VKFIHSVNGPGDRSKTSKFSKKFLSVLSCLSVSLVYCDQTVGRIRMKLGMQVGLGPGHIVLGGDPALPPPKGHSPQFSAHIC